MAPFPSLPFPHYSLSHHYWAPTLLLLMMKARCKSKVMAKQGKAMQGRRGLFTLLFSFFFPPFDFFFQSKYIFRLDDMEEQQMIQPSSTLSLNTLSSLLAHFLFKFCVLPFLFFFFLLLVLWCWVFGFFFFLMLLCYSFFFLVSFCDSHMM